MTMKAFSIIELLVVVICMAALACIAIPRLNLTLVDRYKAGCIAQRITTDLMLARNLAITSAPVNNSGFSVKMHGTSPYRGYDIVNALNNSIVSSHIIDPNITCTGGDSFHFGPLGNLKTGSDTQLTLSAASETTTITIVPSTGAVKCN